MIDPTPDDTMLDLLSPEDFASHVEKTSPAFVFAYDTLSAYGVCDGWGGMESRRVYREWVEAGRPSEVGEFITERANAGPIR